MILVYRRFIKASNFQLVATIALLLLTIVTYLFALSTGSIPQILRILLFPGLSAVTVFLIFFSKNHSWFTIILATIAILAALVVLMMYGQ